MAVTLPSWIQIDPIEPARIRVQANAQRNQAAAQTRQAQQHAQELDFRREQLAVQQAQQAEHDAAQERSAVRRDQVLRQTNDAELAQAAATMQFKREEQAAKAAQFSQTLRVKQEKAEQEAKNAASQMQGMKALQKGLQAGEPLQKLLADNAPLLFSGRPAQGVAALQRGTPKNVLAPSDFVARQLRDEQGNPMGINVIPGANGSIKTLPRTTMTPEGMLRADQLRLGVITRRMEEESDPAKKEKLIQARDEIMSRLERITSGAGAKPAVGASAKPASEAGEVITVKSPSGKIREVPLSVWESTPADQKEGFKIVTPEEEETEAEDE